VRDEAMDSKRIEQYLLEEKKKFERQQLEPKLLILGTSDSGKSTLLKQLKIIHGKGFTPEEIQESKSRIHMNIVFACQKLIESRQELETVHRIDIEI
jgi:ABC-type lipoprotein export system ATPase subunit